ncbi:MAG: DUF1353 domain-containing protein [Pseudomonadota bacterium]
MYQTDKPSEAGSKLIEAERESRQDQPEVYGEGTDFKITLRIPRIIFKSFTTDPHASWLQQISLATKKREFFLIEDWSVLIDAKNYPDLSGTIVIPNKTQGKRFAFDGASIPVPWLVSLLTIGVLRPLGMLLVASIIHDYAFRYGYLMRSKATEAAVPIPVRRDEADSLFRDIISTVNGNRLVGFVAWYAVRLGYWFWVPFNGESGKKPVGVLASFIVFLLAAAAFAVLVGFDAALVLFLSAYCFVYFLTLKTNGDMNIVWFYLAEAAVLLASSALLFVLLPKSRLFILWPDYF